VVVVSALARVTDQLMNAGWAAAAGSLDSAREVLQVLQQRHRHVASALAKARERARLFRQLANEFKVLERMLLGIASEKAFSPRLQDSLLGVGETLSAQLVQSALQSAGVAVTLVDARECIVTDAVHTRATPLWDETNARLQAVLTPLLKDGQVPVMGGFVGATRDGIPTTLGRGGSDFTASNCGRRSARPADRNLDRRGRRDDRRSERLWRCSPHSSHELR
jgi:aspartate kinase